MKRKLLALLMCALLLSACGRSAEIIYETSTTAAQEDTSAPSDAVQTSASEEPSEPTQAPHVHQFGDWSVVVEASCLYEGMKEQLCDCGERQTHIVDALGHDYVDGVCTRCADRLAIDEADDAPAVGTPYLLAATISSLHTTLYFNGGASNVIYLAVTEDPAAAVTVYLEPTEGGFYLYYQNGEEKTYIDTVLNSSDAQKAWLKRVSEPTCVYVWDALRRTLVVTLGDNSFFIGTYDHYRTLSAINLAYITGENAAAIGVTVYPAFLCERE